MSGQLSESPWQLLTLLALHFAGLQLISRLCYRGLALSYLQRTEECEKVCSTTEAVLMVLS